MDVDSPTLKWSLAAVGVVVVCFCLGYFVFGSKPSATELPVVAAPTPASPANLPVTMVESPGLQVEDITAEKEAERKRKAEAEKARLEAKRKAEEAKLATPTPEPEATPEVEPTPDPTIETDPDPSETSTGTEATKGEGEGGKTTGEPAKPEPDKAPSKSLFRVRVGEAKSSREDAEKLIAELRGRGYSPTIIADQRKGKTVFHVQAGAFSDPEAAERRKKELESNGYDVSVH